MNNNDQITQQYNIPQDYQPRRNNGLVYFLMILIALTMVALIVLGALFVFRITSTDSPPYAHVDTNTDTDPLGTDGSEALHSTSTDDTTTTTPTVDTLPPSTDSPVTDPPVIPPPQTAPPEITTGPAGITSTAILPKSENGGKEYLDKIVFMGDSTTYGMLHYADVEQTQVWSPLSGTMDLFDMTHKSIAYPEAGVHRSDWKEILISDALKRRKPEILIVTLGVNYSSDFGTAANGWTDEKKETYFKRQIENIINMVKDNSPDTKLVFQSIYPVIDELLIKSGSSLRQANVDKRNTWLLQVCEEYSVPILWSESELRDSGGYLAEKYNNYHNDGVHLNPDGFKVILEYVCTHMVK